MVVFTIIQYLTGQSLILLHHFLILLVDTQHLTDPVSSRLCLRRKGEKIEEEKKREVRVKDRGRVILFSSRINKSTLF